MKITIGKEDMNIKSEDSWWATELSQISRDGSVGDFSRNLWLNTDREKVKEIWRSSPLWFRKAAGPILGGKFTPKPKQSNNPTHSDLILEDIKHFSQKLLDKPSPQK